MRYSVLVVCSHAKSYNIYARTITSKNYLAASCENPLRAFANFCNDKPKIVMGEHARTNDKGEFLIRIDNNDRPLEDIWDGSGHLSSVGDSSTKEWL